MVVIADLYIQTNAFISFTTGLLVDNRFIRNIYRWSMWHVYMWAKDDQWSRRRRTTFRCTVVGIFRVNVGKY